MQFRTCLEKCRHYFTCKIECCQYSITFVGGFWGWKFHFETPCFDLFFSLDHFTVECQTKMFLPVQKPSCSFCRDFQNSVGLFLVETSCETEVLPEAGFPSCKLEQLGPAQTCATNPGLWTRYFNKALASLFSVAVTHPGSSPVA